MEKITLERASHTQLFPSSTETTQNLYTILDSGGYEILAGFIVVAGMLGSIYYQDIKERKKKKK